MRGVPIRLPDNSYEHFSLVYDAAGFDRFSVAVAPRVDGILRGRRRLTVGASASRGASRGTAHSGAMMSMPASRRHHPIPAGRQAEGSRAEAPEAPDFHYPRVVVGRYPDARHHSRRNRHPATSLTDLFW